MSLPARAALLFAVLCGTATADDAERSLQNTLGGSINLPGIQNALELSWRWRLRDKDSPLIVRESHFAVGFSNSVTPSHARIGAWAQYAPLSIFEVRVGFEPVAYFGIVGSALGYDRHDVDYSQKARDAIKSRAESALGYRAYLAPAVQFKLGKIVGRSAAELDWWRAGVNQDFFYEPLRDTVLRAGGNRTLMVWSALLHQSERSGGRKLSLGPMHRIISVATAPRARSQRLGVIGIYEMGERRFKLNRPVFFMSVYDYVQDPFKKGQIGATAAVSFRLGK